VKLEEASKTATQMEEKSRQTKEKLDKLKEKVSPLLGT
jgi:hypothetical protein